MEDELLEINPGENATYQRAVLEPDGSVTPFSSIRRVVVQLKQLDEVKAEYTYDRENEDAPFAQGMSHLGASQFQILVSRAVSATFVEGYVKAKWFVDVDNASFEDGFERDIDTEQIIKVLP